jgi:hypothetical protein
MGDLIISFGAGNLSIGERHPISIGVNYQEGNGGGQKNAIKRKEDQEKELR